MIKLVIFDADKTLWDHYNISEFEEPFSVIDGNVLRDSKGRTLKVFPNVRRTLDELKKKRRKTGHGNVEFSPQN